MQVKKNIPSLSFIGFEKEWNNFKIEDLVNNKILDKPLDGNHGNIHPVSSDFVKSGIPFVMANNIKNGKLILDDVTFIKKEQADKLQKGFSVEGDLLLTHKGSVGLTAIVPKLKTEYIMLTPQVTYYRVLDKKKLNNQFLKLIFETFRFQKKLKVLADSGTRPYIGITLQRQLTISLPTLPEQQKIASFLSAVDEKIQQLSRKKELLEQYKKGVMQQLFSGQLRFKDEKGKDYPDWVEKLYEEVYSFYSTNSFSRENLNYEKGVVKNIHYGDIHTKFPTLFDVSKALVPFINEDIDITKIKDENYCQEGDLVIADASEDYADIGKSIELFNLNNEKLIAGLHTFLARPNKTKMHKGFSGYLVQSSYVRKQIMTIAQGTKVLSLSTGRLAKIKLQVPSVNEQKKIASFLSNLDIKIESLSTQIAQTQTFKKGLLQQLFV